MKQITTHEDQLVALRRIEGQVKGIQGMIEDKKYCIDIIIQINAATHALYRVVDKIFAKHIEHCVAGALSGGSEIEKEKKIIEIIDVIKKMRKFA